MKGSSPLARGLLKNRDTGVVILGIIPARAGFTATTPLPSGRGRDHPRSRGVYAADWRPAATGRGSSPLARGLRARRPFVDEVGRIIPARAGFTLRPQGPVRRRQDHPRSRGVYPAASPCGRPRPGSSPLARGLQGELLLGTTLLGIIPARAGFTPPWPSTRPTPTDHPRSRGVYQESTRSPRVGVGSSPLARGLLGEVRLHRGAARIIPARAGFTARARRRDPHTRDHPRSRGVYCRGCSAPEADWGSSPLARGLLGGETVQEVQGRIIPARAGFTTPV